MIYSHDLGQQLGAWEREIQSSQQTLVASGLPSEFQHGGSVVGGRFKSFSILIYVVFETFLHWII